MNLPENKQINIDIILLQQAVYRAWHHLNKPTSTLTDIVNAIAEELGL
jgi:hypothetical protein